MITRVVVGPRPILEKERPLPLLINKMSFWKMVGTRLLSLFLMSCLFNTLTRESIAQEMMSGSGDMMLNESCPVNIKCQDLPANCLKCQFNDNCTYGQLTNVTCTPLDQVVCEGNSTIERTFICRYCYQLPDELTCCAPSTTCSVRGTPRPEYTSNCSALNTELCIGSRSFQKKLPCNYTTGIRWSTAFLLSITLGGFGIDRFYLGHWRSGLGKLFSFGGLGVWSILDVILIATGYLTPENGSAYIY